MDNFFLDITSEGEQTLELALKLAFSQHSKATHYRVVNLKPKTTYYARHVPNDSGNLTIEGKQYSIHHCSDNIVDPVGIQTLIFYWTEDKDATLLPFPLDLKGAMSFVNGWLNHANYGVQPDHDGDNGKGFRVFVEDWGHVLHNWKAFVAIQPTWAMYGK